ncbi:MAG: 3-isopropylmalate dehydratase, partial [bacterium]|nr:3-isopropylmalate dehydratase [bacterium]
NKILITGNNFGCGSSREHAVLALRGAGVKAVIAKSFARIFFRNAINNGFPVIEGNFDIQDGVEVEVDLSGYVTANGVTYAFERYPDFLMEIISCGGLMNYLKSKKSGL